MDSSIVNLKSKDKIDSFFLFTKNELNTVLFINAIDEKENSDKAIHKYFVVDNTLDLFTKYKTTIYLDSLNKCNKSNKISLGQLEWPCFVTIKNEIEAKFMQEFNTLEPIIINKTVFDNSSALTIIIQFEINTIYHKVIIL